MFKLFQENKSIKWMYEQQESINFSPQYQRSESLWKKPQKQLLIDSILNGLDIPKFYFQFMPPAVEKFHYNYAIIDGKQRMKAILEFINNELPLSDEFVFLDDDYLRQYGDISGKCFSEIKRDAPALIAQFWQFKLSFVFINTDAIDIIEEFSARINFELHTNRKETNDIFLVLQKPKNRNREGRFAKNDTSGIDQVMHKIYKLVFKKNDTYKMVAQEMLAKNVQLIIKQQSDSSIFDISATKENQNIAELLADNEK